MNAAPFYVGPLVVSPLVTFNYSAIIIPQITKFHPFPASIILCQHYSHVKRDWWRSAAAWQLVHEYIT